MDTKSNLLLYLASKLPDRIPEEKSARATTSRAASNVANAEILSLRQKLQSIREQSLAACRKGDYRTQARLNGEAARITEALRKAEGLPIFTEDD